MVYNWCQLSGRFLTLLSFHPSSIGVIVLTFQNDVEWGAKYLSNVNNIPALIFREHLQSIAFDIALLLKPSSVL